MGVLSQGFHPPGQPPHKLLTVHLGETAQGRAHEFHEPGRILPHRNVIKHIRNVLVLIGEMAQGIADTNSMSMRSD